MSTEQPPSLLKTLVPKGGRAEVGAAGIVIAIVMAMILPPPVWLLDSMLATSICTSALLMVLVLQVKDTIGLSTFPTLLLITTLLRLSLEVASTRLILLEGYAGHIIAAFGDVVVGGNIVVGFVVFMILTLVQFMVITKGAERVAEVGARFTLDAMPGKQMAIDMELRNNAITADQARDQRSLLAQESQFFGAMDGAMKFVKGDAIAGIIIMAINLVGGLSIGILQRDMTASDAMRLYSILTIGDGLVAQVPALLTSLTAGLLVTRAGGGEARNIGRKLAEQLTAQPKAWVTASIVMLAFGFVPGMPLIVFATIATGSLLIGLAAIRKTMRVEKTKLDESAGLLVEVHSFELIVPLGLTLSERARAHPEKLQLINAARNVRNTLITKYGTFLPSMKVVFEEPEAGMDLVLAQNGVPLLTMSLPSEPVIPTQWWADYKQSIELSLRKASTRTFGIHEAQAMFDLIAKLYPALHKELERAVPVSRFAEVIQRLMAEQVNVRNLKVIAQSLADFGQREREPAALAEQVRAALSLEICSAYVVNGVMSAYMLDVELENAVRDSVRVTSHGNLMVFEPTLADPILDHFDQLLKQTPVAKPVILCTQDIRPYVRRLFEGRFFLVPVLTLSEVSSGYKFDVIGVLELYPRNSESPGGDVPSQGRAHADV